jgi:hypothetical protein
VAFATAHAVAALAAVKRLPKDVRGRVLERQPSRGRRPFPVYPVVVLTLALLRRRP